MSRTGVTKIHNSKRRQMYKDDEDDDGVRESTMLSRRRRKRKKVRTEVTTLRPRSSKNKPHLMSNCVRKRMGRYTTINDLKVTVSSCQNYGIFGIFGYITNIPCDIIINHHHHSCKSPQAWRTPTVCQCSSTFPSGTSPTTETKQTTRRGV